MPQHPFADINLDVSDYPADHTYFLFTTSENVPGTVTAAIEKIQSSVAGHSIFQMLLEVSTAINHAISGTGQPDGDAESVDDANEDNLLDEDESDADVWSNDSIGPETQAKLPAQRIQGRSLANPDVSGRIRLDLRLAKEAGFKIGVLGNLDLGGIVCVSIRLTKLGISEEAMNAWGIQRNQYLILLIRYGNGYKNIVDVKEETMSGDYKTEFRVALCRQYKPSVTEAVDAFNQRTEKPKPSNAVNKDETSSKTAAEERLGALEPLFIGRPLNDVMTRLPAILKYRLSCSFSWTGAELFLNEIQSKAAASIDLTDKAFNVGDHPASQVLPRIVTADHIWESFLPHTMSLPLAAMQFLLRHFVRCTEFCLVCHCKIDMDFEALKPYVCSKPLCLFQYMALGFGPSIEWEILSQPFVVDLLVSFCYASAQGHRLKDFPIGIDLKVPLLPRPAQPVGYYRYGRLGAPLPTTATAAAAAAAAASAASAAGVPITPTAAVESQPCTAKFDPIARELLLVNQTAPGPVKIGEWVVVTSNSIEGAYHARVEENFFPTIRLGELIYVPGVGQRPIGKEIPKAVPTVGFVDADFFVYNQHFDELSDQDKRSAITLILDTLPDVMQMKAFLESHAQDPSLKHHRHRISESALNLLRWIIASNRSCIMQVDRTSSSSSFAGAEDRVSGMDNWMQFRFAQGAPDKEQRFMDCVKAVSTRLNLREYPTLFAWHGSPLANWHAIVREGLHFNDTLHGRAYGDGVYMSPNASTSIGYSNLYSAIPSVSANAVSTNWRNSKLCISGAMALNEVVNAPDEYVTKAPHYVVNQIDWIQARYLFVRGNHQELGHDMGTSPKPKCIYQQDPKHPALGERLQPLIIPITAISKSRRPTTVTSPVAIGRKKVKVTGSVSQEQAEKTEDDAASMITNVSDLNVLFSDDDEDTIAKPSNETSTNPSKRDEPPKTDFIPDQLDASTLPLLAPPTNASTSATKALLSTLKQTLHTQNTTPLHELGWYISESLITNIYQWIVELHSFDPSLPLAHDMKSAGLTSIILELRFSNNFPISPPFVRVIRPRFLPFMHGGGGHVTGGGALCMELLTNSGWSPVSSVESVLLQVRMAISSLEPKPARLMNTANRNGEGGKGGGGGGGGGGIGIGGSFGGGAAGLRARDEYSVGEAVEAYKRACAMHGWAVPKEFDDFLKG
jgi:ubiquitin-conjugating enzyme E2 Q